MKKLCLIFLVFYLPFISCKREGCTDGCAKNYDEKAKIDDGSCVYEGTIQFWFDQETAQKLNQDDVSSIAIYVEDKLIGSYSSSGYFTSEPTCNTSNVVRDVLELDEQVEEVHYVVKDPSSNDTLWEGYVMLDACYECNSVQLKASDLK